MRWGACKPCARHGMVRRLHAACNIPMMPIEGTLHAQPAVRLRGGLGLAVAQEVPL